MVVIHVHEDCAPPQENSCDVTQNYIAIFIGAVVKSAFVKILQGLKEDSPYLDLQHLDKFQGWWIYTDYFLVCFTTAQHENVTTESQFMRNPMPTWYHCTVIFLSELFCSLKS